jgi:hypothetical protein
MFGFSKPPVIEVPTPSPALAHQQQTEQLADRVAQAHASWKQAEVVLADACLELNHFRTTHAAHVPLKKIGDQVYFQLTPNDPELIRLSSAENHARNDRDQKQQAWAILHRELHPEETHIAGVRVR